MDTREVRIGNRVIGGGNPVLIQSMTNTKTEDVAGNGRHRYMRTGRRQAVRSSAVPCRRWRRQRRYGEIKKSDSYSAGCGYSF